MSLDRSDVEKIAHLARLALDENQVEGYAAELSNILASGRTARGGGYGQYRADGSPPAYGPDGCGRIR